LAIRSKAQAGIGEGKGFEKMSARAYVEGATPTFAWVTGENPGETSVRLVDRWDRTHDLPNPTPTLGCSVRENSLSLYFPFPLFRRVKRREKKENEGRERRKKERESGMM